jgi:hypothetical protein
MLCKLDIEVRSASATMETRASISAGDFNRMSRSVFVSKNNIDVYLSPQVICQAIDRLEPA